MQSAAATTGEFERPVAGSRGGGFGTGEAILTILRFGLRHFALAFDETCAEGTTFGLWRREHAARATSARTLEDSDLVRLVKLHGALEKLVVIPRNPQGAVEVDVRLRPLQ